MTVNITKERAVIPIPTIEYGGYELHAYPHQVFALHRDPYAIGPRQFSSVVRIDTIASSEVEARRYATLFDAARPPIAGDAIELAMQYGKDIVDGKIEATGF